MVKSISWTRSCRRLVMTRCSSGSCFIMSRSYVEQHIISMYTFLPVMHGVTMALLMQAIHEMEQTYDRPHFARHLFRFQRILMRTTMLSAEEKQAVIEQLSIPTIVFMMKTLKFRSVWPAR